MDKLSILSWNVRGTNKGVNRLNIRTIVSECKAMVLCVQETKRAQWNERLIGSLGMRGDVEWIETPSQGLSGGLLMVWDSSIIKASAVGSNLNWQWLIGSMVGYEGDFVCVNVYAPQKSAPKQELWSDLSSFLSNKCDLPQVLICLLYTSPSPRDRG